MKLFQGKRSGGGVARRRHTSVGDGSAAQQPGTHRATEAELGQRYAFRRNRTLTGSLSSDVMSAQVHNMELKSARVQRHDLHAHRRRLMSILVGVLVIVAGLGFLIYDAVATPVVVAQTSQPFDAGLYEKSIQSYLDDHFLQRQRTTLNSEELSTYLQDHGTPEVKSVDPHTQFAGLGKSRISLVFRRPVVVWHSGNHTSYVDETGAAFERNYFDEPQVQVVDRTGIQTSDNQVLASDRFLGFIGKIIGQMKANGLTVTEVILPENTTRQVQVRLDGVAYPVTCSVDRSAGEQAEDAARAIRYLAQKGISPQYLDVRVSGKAFYQ